MGAARSNGAVVRRIAADQEHATRNTGAAQKHRIDSILSRRQLVFVQYDTTTI
jgi:hypothetical protein